MDENLRPFATDRQWELYEAYCIHGSSRKAAKALDCNKSSINDAIQRIKNRAAKAGYSPDHDMTHPVPDGFQLRGQSTLYDEDGNKRLQWVKTSVDQKRQEEMMAEAVASFSQDIPKSSPVTAPRKTISDLLNSYTITDYHLGALSWADETGEDWDTDIAEDLLMKWFGFAIKSAPEAETAIFAQIGDFLHWDGMDAVTPASKHLLDADTRFQRIVRVAIKVLRRIIQMLLEKHKYVHVIMADANHDPASGIWMREFLAAHYEAEPRVTVDTSPDTYYCYEFGNTSLFFHHGHKRKPENIDDVFVSKFREVFGRTQHSYAHMGHLHHLKEIESNLMLIRQHRTLAAKDAYASRGGYHAGRDARVITYHKEYGYVGETCITPEMLK